jgi:hypothetical protein
MATSINLSRVFWCLVLTLTVSSCSNIDKIEKASPQQLGDEVRIAYDENNPSIKTVRGSDISVLVSFGKAYTGLLLGGGTSIGSSVHLEAIRNALGVWNYQVVASIQYTNLGGVYRHYDKAGIEGEPPLELVTLGMNKHFTVNSINMTEIVSVNLQEELLKSKANSGFTLIITDGSSNKEELLIPASYVTGFLLTTRE